MVVIILIFNLFGLLGMFLGCVPVFIHEKFHECEIRRLSRQTPEFEAALQTSVKVKGYLLARGFTESNYLTFLASRATIYPEQIKQIAQAGPYTSMALWLVAGSWCLCALIVVRHPIFAALSGLFVAFLFREVLAFKGSTKYYTDRFNIKYPYLYDHRPDKFWKQSNLYSSVRLLRKHIRCVLQDNV